MKRRTLIRAAATLPASPGVAAAAVGLPTEEREPRGDFAAKVFVDSCRGGSFSGRETGENWFEARMLTAADD